MELKEKIRIIEKWGDNCESFTAYECYSKAKALLLSEYPIDGEALKRLIKKQNAITDKFASEDMKMKKIEYNFFYDGTPMSKKEFIGKFGEN